MTERGIEKVDPLRLSILPTFESKDRLFSAYGVNTSRETAECSLIYAYTRGDVKKSINQGLKTSRVREDEKLKKIFNITKSVDSSLSFSLSRSLIYIYTDAKHNIPASRLF